ncbi:MAG: hypothetical protein Q4C10_09885 [Clostridia bacterium]|nr:hypothetical protein [Clostridia bacterium]
MGLFTPKWMTDPEETRKLTDQKKLQKAFEKAHRSDVQEAAASRIEDQAFLLDAIENAHGRYMDTTKKLVLKRISRQELLERVVNTDYRDGTGFTCADRKTVIARIANQSLLARIALNDELADNRELAVQCLTDLDALRKVADESRDSRVRDMAAAKVKANAPKRPAPIKSEPPSPPALPASAKRCDWAEGEGETFEAIQNTWAMRVTPYWISEADARALERQQPMDENMRVYEAQYAVECSSNSVLWHPYGAWINPGYVKFLRQGRLYYVSVSPGVQLTQSMFDRKGLLEDMAKVLLTLARHAQSDRSRLLFLMDAPQVVRSKPDRQSAPVQKTSRPRKERENVDDDTLISRFEAAEDDETRLAALRQVKDEAFHEKIARGDYAPALRAAAVNHLRDQALLREVFEAAGDGEVARAALRKLTDQTLLAEVARSGRAAETRALAISRMNDADTLADLTLDETLPEALHRAALDKLLKVKDVAALEKVFCSLPDGVERTNIAGAIKALGSHAADDFIARQRHYSDSARREKLDEYYAARGIGRTGSGRTGATAKASAAARTGSSGGYNALSGSAAGDFVNRLTPRQLMELILLGEGGREAQNLPWLCSRLAQKMMIPHETGDRATIEMFFLAFSGVPARNHYRAMTGFWPPEQASAAFTQALLQFASLPKSLRDIHARLYLEHYGRL